MKRAHERSFTQHLEHNYRNCESAFAAAAIPAVRNNKDLSNDCNYAAVLDSVSETNVLVGYPGTLLWTGGRALQDAPTALTSLPNVSVGKMAVARSAGGGTL